MAELSRDDSPYMPPETTVRVADTRWMVWCPKDPAEPVEVTAPVGLSFREVAHNLRRCADELDAMAELEDMTNDRSN